MTRILALSDTHLVDKIPVQLADLAKGADLILHAGDFVSIEVYETFAELGPLEAVRGNSDAAAIRAILPLRRVVEVGDVRLGLVHMASFSVDPTGAGFGLLAREMDVDILVFGHIHRPYVDRNDRLLICPGSPTTPRMSPPTVAEIEIGKGEVKGRILPLGEASCDYISYSRSLADGRVNKV